MSSSATALIVFACVFGSALGGMLLGLVLPEHHWDSNSRDVVKLGTGLVATLAALVLSLLISSAKGSFDRLNDVLLQSAAKLVLLDRTLKAYGPETGAIRDQIKRTYTQSADLLFSGDRTQQLKLDEPETVARLEQIGTEIRDLSPSSDTQRVLQSRALEISGEMSINRWLFLLQTDEPVPVALLVVLVLWLAIIFTAFGLFAPRNGTVIAALFLSSLCATGAIFLILEMNHPLDGIIRVSGVPVRAALAHLGQ